jgi:hypothetical protein
MIIRLLRHNDMLCNLSSERIEYTESSNIKRLVEIGVGQVLESGLSLQSIFSHDCHSLYKFKEEVNVIDEECAPVESDVKSWSLASETRGENSNQADDHEEQSRDLIHLE